MLNITIAVTANFDLMNGWRLLRFTCDTPIQPGQSISIENATLHIASFNDEKQYEIFYCKASHAAFSELLPSQQISAQLSGEELAVNSQESHLIISELNGINLLHAVISKLACDSITAVLIAASVPFPFRLMPSRFILNSAPSEAIGAHPLIEKAGIPSRLFTTAEQVGASNSGSIADRNKLVLNTAKELNQTINQNILIGTQAFVERMEPTLAKIAPTRSHMI